MLDVDEILRRIDVDPSKTLEPTKENLLFLMNKYLENVPYENLDFVLKRAFSANILKIYEKIVKNNRGGICYESNTLFSFLIKTLGFKVQMIFAKIDDLTYIGADYPHLCLLVEIESISYLVDVSFGQNFREPMPILQENYISISEEIEYKIQNAPGEYVLLANSKQEGWKPRYYFTTDIKRVADFAYIFEGKEYETAAHKTPLLVSLALKKGRITLFDNEITVKENDNKKSWSVTLENRAEVLRDYFKISL